MKIKATACIVAAVILLSSSFGIGKTYEVDKISGQGRFCDVIMFVRFEKNMVENSFSIFLKKYIKENQRKEWAIVTWSSLFGDIRLTGKTDRMLTIGENILAAEAYLISNGLSQSEAEKYSVRLIEAWNQQSIEAAKMVFDDIQIRVESFPPK